MKKLLYKITLLASVVLLSTISAHALLQTKVINKNFKVNPATKIEFDNKFGKVHVNTWDKNEVNVSIEIEISNTKYEAEILQSIDIDIEDRISSNYLGISTSLEDSRRKSSFSINYTVSVPKGNHLTINNKFGDVYISDLNGDLVLNIGYGQLKAEKLNGNCQIDMEFGSGMSEIAFIKKGTLEIKYTKMNIEKAGPLQIDAQFSDIYGGEFSSVNFDMKYGKLITSKIGQVVGEQSFSDFETDILLGDIDLDCKHNHIKIDNIGLHVKEILFDGKFSKMDVGLKTGQDFKLEFDFKFSDLKIKGPQIMFEYVNIDKTEKTYRGFFGKKTGAGLFKVYSEYGDLTLSII